MESQGDSLVFTSSGREIWSALSEDSRVMFANCVTQILYMISSGEKVDVTSALSARIDDLHKLIADGHTHRDVQKKLDDLKDCIRGVDVTHQISNLKMFIESKLSSTINEKGKKGEQEVMGVLEDLLLSSDGFSVDDVSNIAGNCDIHVKRVGYPDVRIDVKNWTSKVGQRDLDKFVKDLTTLNSSGILVSLKSGVVGKRAIEIDQLMNGKFALYLSNFGDHLESIPEFIRLIHTLESACKSGDDTIRLTKHAFSRIEMYVTESKEKVNKVKQQLWAAIAILNDINQEKITEIIRSAAQPVDGATVSVATNSVTTIKCKQCGRTFMNSTGLKTHMKTSKCAESEAKNEGPAE